MVKTLSKKPYLFDFYLLIAVLYNLKSILYARGTLLSQGITALFILLTVVMSAGAVFRTKMPKVLISYLLFIGVLIFYGILLYISGEVITVQASGAKTGGSQYIEAIFFANIPVFASYYLTKKGYFSEERYKIWFFVLLAVCVVSYYHHQEMALLDRSGRQFEDEITNNEAYLFVALIPSLCIFDKKRLIQYIGLVICLFFLITGMKRGALLTGVIELVLLLGYNMRNESRRRKFTMGFLTILVLVFSYYLVQHMLESSEYFVYKYQATIEEGYTSSRDVIAAQIFQYFKEDMSLLDMLFGRGAQATVKMFINYAHNDWLELMVNQGLLGVSLYMVFFIYLFKAYRKSNAPQNRISLLLILTVLFVPTLFSMTYACVEFSLAFYFGHCAAKIKS